MTETDDQRDAENDKLGDMARRAVRSLARHNIDLPASWDAYEALLKEATRLRSAAPPVFAGLPTGKTAAATAAATLVENHAKALAAHRDLQHAAVDVANYCRRSQALIVDTALPDWFGMLSTKFATAVREFASVTITGITADLDVSDLVALQSKQRAADEMSLLAAERMLLGQALGEYDAADGSVWLIAKPPRRRDDEEDSQWSSRLSRWVDLERTYSETLGLLPAFERYRVLLDKDVPLDLAERDQISERRDWFSSIRHEAASQPQLTMMGQQARDAERSHLSVA